MYINKSILFQTKSFKILQILQNKLILYKIKYSIDLKGHGHDLAQKLIFCFLCLQMI